jgi:hypothetical protein
MLSIFKNWFAVKRFFKLSEFFYKPSASEHENQEPGVKISMEFIIFVTQKKDDNRGYDRICGIT